MNRVLLGNWCICTVSKTFGELKEVLAAVMAEERDDLDAIQGEAMR